jgi:hypothetical protein
MGKCRTQAPVTGATAASSAAALGWRAWVRDMLRPRLRGQGPLPIYPENLRNLGAVSRTLRTRLSATCLDADEPTPLRPRKLTARLNYSPNRNQQKPPHVRASQGQAAIIRRIIHLAERETHGSNPYLRCRLPPRRDAPDRPTRPAPLRRGASARQYPRLLGGHLLRGLPVPGLPRLGGRADSVLAPVAELDPVASVRPHPGDRHLLHIHARGEPHRRAFQRTPCREGGAAPHGPAARVRRRREADAYRARPDPSRRDEEGAVQPVVGDPFPHPVPDPGDQHRRAHTLVLVLGLDARPPVRRLSHEQQWT